MKTKSLILSIVAFASLAFGVDSLDQAGQKLVAGSRKPAPNLPPASQFSHALIDNGNSILLSAWGGSLIMPSRTPFNPNKYTKLTNVEPTAARTSTLPDSTGTLMQAQASTTTALTADNQAVTPGANRILQLTSDNATATNRTFTLSATGAITGMTYILIGPASNQCELADTGIQKLSATWTPGPTDTLTLLFDGTNFIELARADN